MLNHKIELFRGLFIALSCIGYGGFYPAYWVGAIFGFLALRASPHSSMKVTAQVGLVLALILQFVVFFSIIYVAAGHEQCHTSYDYYNTYDGAEECRRRPNNDGWYPFAIAGIIQYAVGLFAIVLTDMAILESFPKDESLTLRRSRTSFLGTGMFGLIYFPLLFWGILVAYLVTLSQNLSAHPRSSSMGYTPVALSAGVFTLVEIGCMILTFWLLINSHKWYSSRLELGQPVLLAFTLFVHALTGLIFTFFADRSMVRLINDPPPRNGGVIVTSTGGARVVQPGVATMARDNCPSCGVQLEYTRSFGNTTQVQCYECQALVEFDH